MPNGVQSDGYARLSKLLTEDLAATGAKSLAATVRTPSNQPRLLATSAGASIAFVELCLGLAEAPQRGGVRELEVDGLGHVTWQAAASLASEEGEVLLFALRDQGRLTPASMLIERLTRICEPALN